MSADLKLSPEAAEVRPTRVVVAAALLSTIGVLGVIGPLAIVSLIGFLVFQSGHGGGPTLGSLATAVASSVVTIPALSVVALAAAAGLHTGRTWARPAGLVVAGLLLAGTAARLLVLGSKPPEGELETLLPHHLALLPGGLPYTAPLNIAVGVAIGWALATARVVAPSRSALAARRPSGSQPRRVSVAALVLVVLAVDALIPIVAWLAGLVGPTDDGERSSIRRGLPVIATAGLVSYLLWRARTTVVRRDRRALVLGPAAAAVGVGWVGPWMVILAAAFIGTGEAPIPVEIIPILVIGVVAVAWPVVLAGTIGAHRWYEPGAEPAQRHGRARGPRRATVAIAIGGIAGVVLSFVAVLAPPPRGEYLLADPSETPWVAFQERVYRRFGSLDTAAGQLEVAGTLEAWSLPDLTDPTAHALEGIDSVVAIVVRELPEHADDPGMAVFVGEEAEADVHALAALCAFVTDVGPDAPSGACGPPATVLVDGHWYRIAHQFDLPPAALTATGASAEFLSAEEPDDPTVWRIDGVPLDDALVLRIDGQVVTYLPFDRYGAPTETLCAFVRPGAEPAPGCVGGSAGGTTPRLSALPGGAG